MQRLGVSEAALQQSALSVAFPDPRQREFPDKAVLLLAHLALFLPLPVQDPPAGISWTAIGITVHDVQAAHREPRTLRQCSGCSLGVSLAEGGGTRPGVLTPLGLIPAESKSGNKRRILRPTLSTCPFDGLHVGPIPLLFSLWAVFNHRSMHSSHLGTGPFRFCCSMG